MAIEKLKGFRVACDCCEKDEDFECDYAYELYPLLQECGWKAIVDKHGKQVISCPDCLKGGGYAFSKM